MSRVAAGVFGVSLLACGYVYAGYPALIYALSRWRRRPVRKAATFPRLSIVIPVYNEEEVLRPKLQNTISLDYPGPQPDVIVVSDGSTDGSEVITREFVAHGVRLVMLPRGGKARALNEGVRCAAGDIIVFTDANCLLDRNSLVSIAQNFADPDVGGVCGNKKYVVKGGSDTTEAGENLYWRYDKWQKQLESDIGSVFAADGTLYAIRRELYVPLSDPAQADDIAISTRVVLQGYRLIYEPAAVAWEEAPVEGREEFLRKIRVTNHSVRALLNLGPALWASGFYSVELISHKLLRHFAPFFLIALFGSSVVLSRTGRLFAGAAGAQAAFYSLAGAGYRLRHRRAGQHRAFTVPYYFSLVNAAALIGILSIVVGKRLHAWNPRGGLS
jgi:cellulose synthase/poly-beta-1,6-N-acetylglucosamine synthase-like glycosyltransferase